MVASHREDPFLASDVADRGYAWIRGAVDPLACAHLRKDAEVGVSQRLRSPEVGKALRKSRELMGALTSLGLDLDPVRLTVFSKGDGHDWGVPWHQDRVIAVASRCEVNGYHAWTPKLGYWHCEAPMPLLNAMVFVRILLDRVTDHMGGLELAAGSHRLDRVESADAAATAARFRLVREEGDPGDALVVHALTLHRSRRTESLAPRRVIRADFARRSDLAAGLCWALPAARCGGHAPRC